MLVVGGIAVESRGKVVCVWNRNEEEEGYSSQSRKRLQMRELSSEMEKAKTKTKWLQEGMIWFPY
jgi:hypothetical protein